MTAALPRPLAAQLLRMTEKLKAQKQSIFIGRSDDGSPLFASNEDSVLVLGKARSEAGVTGKSSGIFSPSVACHPGLVVTTTVRSGLGTHPDVRDTTYLARSALAEATGGVVVEWVLDDAYPTLGDRGWWDMVAGARDWSVALDRAESLAYAAISSRTNSPEYFRNQAKSLLAPLLCYADFAVPRLTDADIGWIVRNGTWDPGDAADQQSSDGQGMYSRIFDHLELHLGAGHVAAQTLRSFFNDALLSPENRSTVLSVVLGEVFSVFMHDRPTAVRDFDVTELLRGYSTLYVSVPEGRARQVRPLISAFVNSLVDLWRKTPAVLRPPTVLLALDEVRTVAPIETLPSLVSTGGGDGISAYSDFRTQDKRATRGENGHANSSMAFRSKCFFLALETEPTCKNYQRYYRVK